MFYWVLLLPVVVQRCNILGIFCLFFGYSVCLKCVAAIRANIQDLLVVMQTTFRIRDSCIAALSVLLGFGLAVVRVVEFQAAFWVRLLAGCWFGHHLVVLAFS